MATTSDMNTPEHGTQISNNISENKLRNVDQLFTRPVHNHIRPIQGRDYGRILREYNTPAQWYKPSPITRSIYYYDPMNQKYRQQQSKPTINVRLSLSPIRVSNQSKSRTKSTMNPHHHQQKSTSSSRLPPVRTLPPLVIHKKATEE